MRDASRAAQARARAALAASMCIFGTVGLLRRALPLPSGRIALVRAAVGLACLLAWPAVLSLADNPRTVNRKDNMGPLQRRIMQHLVKTPLEKGRIDRKHRNISLDRQSGRKGYRVFLGNPDIKKTPPAGFGKSVQPGSNRHRRGNRADFWILAMFDHFRPKDR